MAIQSLNLDLPTFAEIRRAKKPAAPPARSMAMPRRYARTYQAAQSTNQNASWSMAQTSANQELRRGLRPMRARSRESRRNDALFKRFIWMMGQGVAGVEGLTLSDVIEGDNENELDATFNEEFIKGFTEWSKPENASSSGKMSFADQQKLAIEIVCCDGEVLIRKRLDVPNKFGFALQFLDVAWLDETFNTVLSNGHRVLMSVELNDFDRPVAYWLTRPASDLLYPEYGTIGQRTRVPAEEIYHRFIVGEHETQARGEPHGHAVLEMLHTIHGYVDGELYKNRAAACITDYLIPPKNDEWNEFYEEKGAAETQAVDGFVPGATRELESAMQQILPPGWEIKTNDVNLPSGNFAPFVEGTQRYVATGLNVPYFRLASDLKGVNFTSSRAGDQEAKQMYRYFQRWLKEQICIPVVFDWAKEQMLRKVVPIRQIDYERLAPTFDTPGWESVDPETDANAAASDINNFIDTRTRIAAEKGRDFRKVVRKLAEEQKLLKQYGLELSASKKNSSDAPEERAMYRAFRRWLKEQGSVESTSE